MGRMQTLKSKEVSTVQKAHRMATAFAEHSTKEYLKRFLEDSGLAKNMHASLVLASEKITLEQVKEEMMRELDLAFGGQICLAYAKGYLDSQQGKTLKTLYVPGDGPSNSTNEKPSQLILPGMGNDDAG